MGRLLLFLVCAAPLWAQDPAWLPAFEQKLAQEEKKKK